MGTFRRSWLFVVTGAVALCVLDAAAQATEQPVGPPPGLPAYPAALAERLRSAVVAKGPDYTARTHHLTENGWPKYTNRLILESSPYLLQHAHNPVNWYPWGDEAFERAAREGKPVLLSVGYSTCHWCHVMEEESFEDVEIATYLNQNYIAVKVDRERRPDVDGVYMTAVRVMSRRGGWPMTVWLTPDRQPFFGGTYFPPRDGDRGSRVGFLSLLKQLKQRYDQNPDDVVRSATEISQRVAASMRPPRGEGLPDAAVLQRAFAAERSAFDARHGGFGRAPKFPRSVRLEFLVRYHARTGDEEAMRMARATLDAMARGGMYDQLGGGFHRYSTDARWLVPHFEKMLYDNALLAVAYLEAYQATGDPEYARVCRDILRYVTREMTAPQGGFYSATDADSEGEEGTFFVWTPRQIEAALTADLAKLAIAYYGVTEKGNFEGKNILHRPRPLTEVAAELGIDPVAAETSLAAIREKLYQARAKRVPPLRDDKILTSWNGLMISAFARAGFVFAEPEYIAAASRAARFVLDEMRVGERLRRAWLDGKADGEAFLDDYAFLVAGLLDLYESSFDPQWLRAAIELQAVLDERFWDAEGGYFLTADDAEALLAREKSSYDGAEPSGNSVALQNLLRLYELTTGDAYRKHAEASMKAFERVWTAGPASVPLMLCGIDYWLTGAKEIVIVAAGDVAEADPFLGLLRSSFVPNRVLTVVAEGEDADAIAEVVPLVRGKKARGGKATAYVCEGQVCDLPTSDPQVFAQQLARHRDAPAGSE